MIVDMRVRPPIPALLKSVLFQEAQGVQQTRHEAFPRPPSAVHKSLDMLLAEMDAVDMRWAVVMGRQSMEPFGIIPNDEIAELMETHPGRFVGWAGVNLAEDMDACLAEIRRCMALPGFRGVSVEPSISLHPDIRRADDRRLYPIYEECLRLDVPVNVTLSGVLQRLTRQPYELSSPTQIYQVALDFPKLDIHVAHAAYPHVMDMIGIAFTCPNVWLSADLYMAPQLPGSGEYAKAACNYFQNRTVFGSNYPSKPFPQMIDAYRQWGWPADVEANVLGRNALRLMRMA